MSTLAGDSSSSQLRAFTNSNGYDYLLSLPVAYSAEPQRRWPLILFLHGSAFRGTDVSVVGTHGLPRLLTASHIEVSAPEIAARTELAATFIVLAPQCPDLEVWDDVRLLRLLDEAGAALHVDSARVYLTGLSMGGFGAWSLGIRHPQRFAAVVPICGGGRLADIQASVQDRGGALQDLAVWAFHGARDTVVPSQESERMITALKAAGVRDARLTVYPEGTHDAWSATYANPELYAWLLRHAR